MSDENLEAKIEAAVKNPRNLGEMENADAVGTVGSPDCGDMLRMWVKFKEEDGRKIIDRASFQSFGCQTAIAVASVATELLAGKTVEEAISDVRRRTFRAARGVAAGADPLRAACGRRLAQCALAGEQQLRPAPPLASYESRPPFSINLPRQHRAEK